MRVLALVPSLVLLAAAVGTAGASSLPGAWTTFMRARQFTALIADSEQVWGASAEAGLLRWDRASQSFEIVRRQPGAIVSNHLTALAQDRSGRLWVATKGSGVSRRSADGRRFDVVNLLDGLPSDSVRVLEATGDTVWIGTTRGFSLWNGRQVSGSLPDGLTTSFDTTFSSVAVTGIALHGDSLWIATRRGIGLARLSHQLSDWRPVVSGLLDTDVRALASDRVDLFAHVGTDVYRWREDLSQWALEPLSFVHRLTDAAGAVLAASDAGAFRWVRTATDSGWVALPGAPIASAPDDPEITMDSKGQAFATVGETLFVAPTALGSWTPFPLPEGPPSNDLLQVVVEGPRVYMTTGVEGVARYDGSWRYWPPVSCSGLGCDTTFWRPLFVNGLFADHTGRKWAGSWSQAIDVFRDDLVPPQFTHPVVVVDPASQQRSWFVSATEDSSGAVWLGMDTPFKGDVDPIGLEVYEPSGIFRRNYNQTNTPGMSGNLVRGLGSTRNGRVWIGYDAGGLDFIQLPDTATFNHISSTNGLAVHGIATYGDSVWLVTTTQLWRFSSSAAVSSQAPQKITLRAGLPLLGFKPLAVGLDGAVWVGTSEGLRVFRPGGARDSFTTENSPIPEDEVRALAVDPVSGDLWLTTPGGLARFDPTYVPPKPPPLASLHAHVFPNPALLTGLGVQLRIKGEAESYSGEIYDLSGRRVWTFHGAGNGGLFWNGDDQHGRQVPPGIYFLRAQAQGRSTVTRIVLLR